MLPPANLAMAAVPAAIAPVPSVTAVKTPAVPDVKLNVSDLLSKLVNAGIIGSGEKSDCKSFFRFRIIRTIQARQFLWCLTYRSSLRQQRRISSRRRKNW